MGTPMAVARASSLRVPMMALRTPPPDSPTGAGSWVKKLQLRAWAPFQSS
jgi:hypothetical protein